MIVQMLNLREPSFEALLYTARIFNGWRDTAWVMRTARRMSSGAGFAKIWN